MNLCDIIVSVRDCISLKLLYLIRSLLHNRIKSEITGIKLSNFSSFPLSLMDFPVIIV